MLNEFASLLQVISHSDPDKTTSTVKARLIGIGLGVTCGRCGGTGSYSFNLMDGTRCYGCNGAGQKAPALTRKTLAAAEQAVVDGKLTAYFEYQRDLRLARNAAAIVMQAWQDTGISSRYDWRKACEKDAEGNYLHPEDRRMSDVNSRMYAAHDRVWVMAQTLPKYNVTKEQVDALVAAMRQAVNEIKTTAQEI